MLGVPAAAEDAAAGAAVPVAAGVLAAAAAGAAEVAGAEAAPKPNETAGAAAELAAPAAYNKCMLGCSACMYHQVPGSLA